MQPLFCAIFEEWILKIENGKPFSTIPKKYSAAMKIDPPLLCHNTQEQLIEDLIRFQDPPSC
jgi:hypothetical protein